MRCCRCCRWRLPARACRGSSSTTRTSSMPTWPGGFSPSVWGRGRAVHAGQLLAESGRRSVGFPRPARVGRPGAAGAGGVGRAGQAVAAGVDYAAWIPGARWVTISDAGHAPGRGAAADAVLPFLAGKDWSQSVLRAAHAPVGPAHPGGAPGASPSERERLQQPGQFAGAGLLLELPFGARRWHDPGRPGWPESAPAGWHGVAGAAPLPMREETGIQIVGDAGIETAVAAFQQIQYPRHRGSHGKGLCPPFMPAASPLRLIKAGRQGRA